MSNVISFLEKKRDDLQKEVNNNIALRKASAEWVKRNHFLELNLDSFDKDYFIDVITGNVKFAVKTNNPFVVLSSNLVLEDTEAEGYNRCRRFLALKAFSLVFRNREYCFEVNRYSDGSGCSDEYTFNYYLKTLESAKKRLEDTIIDI